MKQLWLSLKKGFQLCKHNYQPVEALFFNGLETMLHCTLPSENSYKLFTVHMGLSATATESDSASHLDAIGNTYHQTHAGMNVTLDPDLILPLLVTIVEKTLVAYTGSYNVTQTLEHLTHVVI